MDLLNLAIKSIFIDNMVFAYFLGMCSYLAVSKKVDTAFGLGAAVTFVLTITVPLNWLVYNYILKEGALAWVSDAYAGISLDFLTYILFIAVVASTVQLVEMIIEKFSPSLYGSLGIFLPLIAVNCSILGAAFFMVPRDYNIIQATVYGFSSGIGWLIAIVALAAIRERMKYSNVPAPLKGLGITFIITGLMGLAFMSFMGISL
ncbi:NADH:ubiquinone reductase (Na(+)-transporting) subunit E [Flammeovirga pacifica]|uniref:Na(+)-translocating NADH-quinone reductase subunit E n=1 Tax=Flammeovirga pacifica TaxID=915059 RepID=A0A1S1YYH1_FLAPC|nr:NADH:ubiquinone reductase (Na(+)-transporting) subunit E [Flammeovirga pacifica]OHX66048.1 NADH:ubiquinone reductase (Na(+)-transporting) subunit E [Flammeovirga pacifica]